MTKWEYKVVVLQRVDERQGLTIKSTWPDVAWKEMGADGWELVSVTPVSRYEGATREIRHYFKRPLD